MLSSTAFTLLLSLSTLLIPEASATYLGKTNWGCSNSLRIKAPQVEKDSCSGAGSFFTEFLGKAICCSDKTRTPPRDITCPRGWSVHKQYKICIPPAEVGDCECGEGFWWLGRDKKCKKNENNKCKPGQWWHDRSGSCCDDSWEHNPPKGDCDTGKSCPGGWFWHKQLKKCKPQTPHAPSPDCGDWDNGNQCCGGHGPEPSKKPEPPHPGPGNPSGPGGPGGPGGPSGPGGPDKHPKRDFIGRAQDVIVPAKPLSDLDKLYCPAGLHACSVPGLVGSEWAYECIDFATELESCGGCASTGDGQDCSAIPNAVSVGCEAGACAVYSCLDGFAINGTSCVSVL